MGSSQSGPAQDADGKKQQQQRAQIQAAVSAASFVPAHPAPVDLPMVLL